MQVTLSRRGLHTFDVAELGHSNDYTELALAIDHLDLSFNTLNSIDGLHILSRLTVLDISNNGLSTLEGGLPLTLTTLNVSHNNLISLRGGALLPLQHLTSLCVSHNQLTDLRGMPDITGSLREVDASHNQLESLRGLERCVALERLNATSNVLKDVADVTALRQMTRLYALFLAENPLLLRKRRVCALRRLLCSELREYDLPSIMAVEGGGNGSSLNTSTQSTAWTDLGADISYTSRSPQSHPLLIHPADTSLDDRRDGTVGSVRRFLDTSGLSDRLSAPAQTAAEAGSGRRGRATPVVPFTQACQVAAGAQRGRAPPSNLPLCQPEARSTSTPHGEVRSASPTSLHRALVQAQTERDAYREQVAQLTLRVQQLQVDLATQSDALAMALRINTQLQERMQRPTSAAPQRSAATTKSTEATAPHGLPPAPSSRGTLIGKTIAAAGTAVPSAPAPLAASHPSQSSPPRVSVEKTRQVATMLMEQLRAAPLQSPPQARGAVRNVPSGQWQSPSSGPSRSAWGS